MRLSISRRQRSLLLFVSASSLVAWFAGIGDRLGAQDIDGQLPTRLVLPAERAPRDIARAILRDPFEASPAPSRPDVAPAESGDVAAATPSEPIDSVRPPDQSDVVVPDIAVNGRDPEQAPLVVRATITGANAVAYVQNGSLMDIVRVGDTLGERRVTAIDLRGIRFDDDSRLDLAAGYAATPTPLRPLVQSITLRLEDLRRLIAPNGSPPPALIPAVAGTGTAPIMGPSPLQTPALPATPAPLQTADSRGLLPGVTPTPDLTGPTAFPYPYPYAPIR